MESTENVLLVETPRGTRSRVLFEGGHRHLLAFSAESIADTQRIVPGCRLLDALKFELSGMGSEWILNEARGVSAAGDRIVGWGVNPEGGIEAWLVTGFPFDVPEFTHE